MDLKYVEGQFHVLQSLHASGELAEDAYRLAVAKLLWQDHTGSAWMIDADTGTWFRSEGEDWEPGDPHTDIPALDALAEDSRRRRFRWARMAAMGTVFMILTALLILVAWQLWRDSSQVQPRSALPAGSEVRVIIASPADGSSVLLGQGVAVESTISGVPDLQVVDRAELHVDGQTVDTQSVRTKLKPGQTSFPLSQPWLPATAGEHEVAVLVFSSVGALLDSAAVTLEVAETIGEGGTDQGCIPDATFAGDVTIPPGTAFPPGARMDKVWRARNDGSCAWGVGYELVLQDGEEMGAPVEIPVPPTNAGQTADLAVTFWAPATPGSYSSTWRLRAPDGSLFGPALTLSIVVEVLAEESQPPAAPANIQATVAEDGESVRLVWEDRSDNEDAFRVYREDVEASIGLVPSGTELFVDEDVACNNVYRYGVVAFNASGASALSQAAEVAMPTCAPSGSATGMPSGAPSPAPPGTPAVVAPTDPPSVSPAVGTPVPQVDAAPTLTLALVPTDIVSSRPFTVTFRAEDDLGVAQVVVWGVETGNSALDRGRIFTCTRIVCTGSWVITPTQEITVSWQLIGLAFDTSRQQSEPAEAQAVIRPPKPTEEDSGGSDDATTTPNRTPNNGTPVPTEAVPVPTGDDSQP